MPKEVVGVLAMCAGAVLLVGASRRVTSLVSGSFVAMS